MSAWIQQAQLAGSAGFQERIQGAILAEAATVLASSPTAGFPVTFQLRTSLATQVVQNPAQYVTQFAWAVVGYGGGSGGTLSGDISDTMLSISASSGTPCSVTTSAVHGLSTGQTVAIARMQDPNLFGTWTVTVTSTTTFTVPVAGSITATAGGSVQPQVSDSDIATAVAAVWSSMAGVTPLTL